MALKQSPTGTSVLTRLDGRRHSMPCRWKSFSYPARQSSGTCVLARSPKRAITRVGGRRAAAALVRMPILSDVARQAEVSLTTASRALDPDNDHPVNARTRARVQGAAVRLSYRPNPMARALRTRRVPTIAIVVHDVSAPYFAEVVRGATSAASARGLLTLVCSSDRDPLTELRYVEMLCLSRASGVIFAGGGIEEAHYRRAMSGYARSIADYGGAIVALAPRADRWAAELPDNRGGARIVTEHLLALGHVGIAMIGGPAALRTSRERELGYATAMKDAGRKPKIVAADFTPAGGAAATAFLVADPSLTAVFAAS